MYVTDNLMAYVSWKQAWEMWLEMNGKEEEDYCINSMEAQTHKGRIYFGKVDIELTGEELTSFEE